MNPRGKIIAAQAAAVTALVVVVYVTLLRPEGPSSVTGIEAPDGGAGPRIEAPERPGKPRQPAEDGGRRRPPSRGAGAVTATGVAPPAGDVAPAETPPGDQYDDAVKALMDRVSAARVPGQ